MHLLLRLEYERLFGASGSTYFVRHPKHLQAHTYLRVEDVIVSPHVKMRFDVIYTVRGMTDCLHRLEFAHKKPKLVPGKADPEAQQEFVEAYEKL